VALREEDWFFLQCLELMVEEKGKLRRSECELERENYNQSTAPTHTTYKCL
jgi:hypothetical protein